MAWDSTRPVPWKRLMIEWLVIGVVVALVSWFATDNRKPENYISIVLAGGIYVGFGALLAKLGYARKSLKQLRAETDLAMAKGVFGSPFVIVDGEPFWGFDRLDQVEALLRDGRI